MFRTNRNAFTVIELLVVISIIAVLLGLLMPALGLIRKSQRKASTLALMNNVALAITQYLAEFPKLGTSEADFENDPWRFLYRDPMNLGKAPYMTLTTKNLAQGTPPGPYSEASESQATVILDSFTSAARNNALVFDVVNRFNGTLEFTDSVTMTSLAGTQASTKDDLILRLDLDSGNWDIIDP